MARYWRGGTGNWDVSTTTNWSTSSGGSGGASVPTSSDDVYFDANSGGGTVTTAGILWCSSLDFTGYTGTLSGTGVIVPLGILLKFSSTMTFDTACPIIQLNTNANDCDVYCSGATINTILYIFRTGKTINLKDTFRSLQRIVIFGGTLTTNNNDVYVLALSSNSNSSPTTEVRTFNLGSSKIYLTYYANLVDTASGTVTLNAGTSEFIANSNQTSFPCKDGLIFYDLTVPSAKEVIFYDSINTTFNKITVKGGGTLSAISSTLVSTVTVSDLVSEGTIGNPAIIGLTGKKLTLTKPSGTVNVSYASIYDTTATGGATWNAIDSVDGGGNTGWNFTSTYNPAFAKRRLLI